MAIFPNYGLKREDGILVRLVDDSQKPLPFLNPETITGHNDHGISFVPTKPLAVWDVVIPVRVSQVPEWFFPHDASRFTVGTDDEQAFECRFIEESSLSGLHFTGDVSQVQQYFRKRLAVSSGVRITTGDFARYGTHSFLMFRLDETIYFADFSPDVEQEVNHNPFPGWREVIIETRSPQYASRCAQKEARERGLPFYPGRLGSSEPLPYLPYNLAGIVVIRQQATRGGNVFQVALEGSYK